MNLYGVLAGAVESADSQTLFYPAEVLLISLSSVPAGNPRLMSFFEASRHLGLPPAECLVMEDSLVGVQAARAAHLRCVALPSRAHEQDAIAREPARRLDAKADAVDHRLVVEIEPALCSALPYPDPNARLRALAGKYRPGQSVCFGCASRWVTILIFPFTASFRR